MVHCHFSPLPRLQIEPRHMPIRKGRGQAKYPCESRDREESKREQRLEIRENKRRAVAEEKPQREDKRRLELDQIKGPMRKRERKSLTYRRKKRSQGKIGKEWFCALCEELYSLSREEWIVVTNISFEAMRTVEFGATLNICFTNVQKV